MKKILFLIIISILSVQAFAQTTETYYTCVMHPEIHASKPGKCPKCGMDLYKKTVAVKKTNPSKTLSANKDTTQISAKDTEQETDTIQPASDTTHKHDMGNMDML